MRLKPPQNLNSRQIVSWTLVCISLTMILVALSACATAVQPKNQRIQFTAVNGEEPKCIVETPLNKYVAYPPQHIQVERSRYTLVVDCTANGGKHRRLLIQPEHNPTSSYLQGPFQLVDRVTGSAWNYPPYIRIDFDWEDPFFDPIHPDGSPPYQARGKNAIKPDKLPRADGFNN